MSKVINLNLLLSAQTNANFVYNFFRHWVSKHSQDFEQDTRLRARTAAFLDDITCSPNLLPAEHRAAAQLLRLLCRGDEQGGLGPGTGVGVGKVNLEKLLAPSQVRIK